MDNWQFLDEVDVMAKWPSESKKVVFEGGKWSERKEALETLNEQIVKNPRLSTSSMTIYGELMDEIRKILDRESNIVVVTTTIRTVELLATGLRAKFGGFIGMVLPFLIKRAKDKKKNVRDAILAALLAVSDTTSSERLQKDIIDWFTIPSPESKQTLLSFIFAYFTRQNSMDLPFIKAIMPLCVKCASDSDVTVREKACSAIGSIRRLLGDGIAAFLGPISTDSAKIEKIQQYEKEAIEEANKWAELKGVGQNQENLEANEDGGEPSSTTENGAQSTGSSQIDPWELLDPEDVSKKIEKSAESQLVDKNWKERVAGVESVKSAVESAGRLEIADRLREIMILMIKIIEKDVNVNVAALAAQTLTQIATRSRFAYAPIANRSFPVIFDKLKDKKALLRDALIELSDASATTTPLSSYTEAVLGGLGSKNPQSRQQTALFLARFFAKNDAKTMEVEAVKQLVDAVQKTSNDADKDVREAVIRTVAAIQKSLGEPLAAKLMAEVYEDKLKADKIPATISQLEEEFGKTATVEMVRLAAHYNLGQKKPAVTSAKPPVKKPTSAGVPATRRPGTAAAPPAIKRTPISNPPPVNKPASAGNPATRRPVTVAPAVRRAPSPRTVAPPPSGPKPFVARPAPNFGKPKVATVPANNVTKPTSRGTIRPATSSAPPRGKITPIAPNVVRSQPTAVTNRPIGIARPNTATGAAIGGERSRIATPSGIARPLTSGIPRAPSNSRIARPPSRNGSRNEIDRI